MVRAKNIPIPGYDSKASRVEFCIVRCFYAIPVILIGGLVALVFALIAYILWVLNFLSVVIFGKRIESLYNIVVRLTEWQAKVGLYFYGLTDERPPIIP